MKRRQEIDPELHTLRSIALLCDGRNRAQIETARFQIYAAFETSSPREAVRWLIACRIAIRAAAKQIGASLGAAEHALGVIEEAIKITERPSAYE